MLKWYSKKVKKIRWDTNIISPIIKKIIYTAYKKGFDGIAIRSSTKIDNRGKKLLFINEVKTK